MKRFLLIILLMFIMILTSCGYNGYTGNHDELYSVATHSVLWLNGYSWGADYKCDPQIEIIEEDNFGRIMFTYYEKYYKGSNLSFSALIICQYSNEKEVFYYEDINYIVKEQVLYSQDIEEFSSSDIEYLKQINDWNKEIDYDKCVKKDITKTKQKPPKEKEILDIIIDKFELVNGNYSLFIDYLTSNIDGSKYMVYGYVRKTEQEGIYFIGLVENIDVIKLNIIVPTNVYDYKVELIKFKELNEW